MPRFAVEPLDIVLDLLRDALPGGTTARASIPDNVPDFLPLVVVRRISAGGSPWPQFWDEALINVQCWADADGPTDASRVCSNLADEVRRILWTSWRNQTVTPGGSIARIRESLAPTEMDDVDLPFLGRYAATYGLMLRSPHPI